MAEERIDVEVTDKVDANAAKKLNQIADAADRGATYVDKLKAALANVNTSSVDKLVSAMARADSAQAKLLNAQVRLSNAQDQGAMAAAKLATQNQKLATEAARTEAATARAAAASAGAEAAALRLAAAQQRVTGASAVAASAEDQLAAAQSALNARLAAGEINIRTYVAELQKLNAAAGTAAGAADQVGNAADRSAGALGRAAAAGRNTSQVNANIIAQLQDIGVSLAGGQNPLLVMIQQGSQLDYIARSMNGGWTALLGTILKMVAPLAVIGAAIAGLYMLFKNFSADMATKHKPELEAYAKSLGLTEKEMKKLGNTTVGANGKLKEFDTVTITMADSWNGFRTTVAQGWAELIAPFMVYNDTISSAWSTLQTWMLAAFVGFSASVTTLIKLLGAVVVNIFKAAYNAGVGIFNGMAMLIQGVVNTVISGINLLSAGANKVTAALGFDAVIPQLDKVDLGIKSISQGMAEATEFDLAKTWQDDAQTTLNTIRGFAAAWDKNSVAAAKARLANQAAAIIDNRGPGKKGPVDRTAVKRAHALDMTNLKLDDELARMKMLKDERAIQQRMDQIEESLAQKKIKLNDQERASILAKVRAIEEYKYVQQEMDRIYEDATGPMRTYNASIAAATQLLEQHNITQDQFNQEKVKATRAMQEATDPLFGMKEALDTASAATGKYGIEVDRANYYEQIRQAMLAKGIVLTQQYVAGANAEVDALVRKNDQLRQQQLIQSQLGSVLNPILDQNAEITNKVSVYQELERLRQEDLINEQTYQQAKYALDAKYSEMRLNTASDFFGALAGITRGGTGVIGAINKAAAVAQATIDGYVAAQKALASAPPPFNYIAAAAIGLKTGANVAAIMSTNAGSYATGGQFMVQGRGGIDANNINMNVTKGERVTVETPAQQRANDAANDSGSPYVDARTKVVNMFDEASFIGAMDSDEGERVVMNIIRRNPQGIQSILSR